jgi:8-oxo-dGTP pyrophosphatase MutT (NUDIX family)
MSNYVSSIRSKIGTELLFLSGASVFAFDDQGRVLLGQEPGGMWSSIGGAIEPGERPADAAVREFWEEAGALVEIVRVLGVFGGPEFFHTYANGDRVIYTSMAFEAKIVSGELKHDDLEFGRLAWFTAGEIEDLPMRQANRIVARAAIAGRERPVHQPATWRP